jgi:hypothetical protein
MVMEIITTIEQQKEVYAALKNNKESVERWESLMRIVAGLNDKTIAVIKGEDE